MVVGRVRLVRRARDLIEVVRDLRRVERAQPAPVIARIDEREDTSPIRLGG